MNRWRLLGVLACWVSLAGHAHEWQPSRESVSDPTLEIAVEFDHHRVPLLPVPTRWSINDTWKARKVGPKNFYFVENGPFSRLKAFSDPELHRALRETGIWQRAIPGFIGSRELVSFRDTSGASPAIAELLDQYLANQWPIWSISYATARELPAPDRRSIDVMGDLWVGDGSTEYMTYRLEGVSNYLRSAKLGQFSSSGGTHSDSWARYMEDKLIPELRKVLPAALRPGAFSRGARWSHADARTLSNAFMKTYFEKIGKPVAWGSYLSPYYLALMPENVAVGQRNSNPLHIAHARGIMRTAGGNKFFMSWQTGEETTRWMGKVYTVVPAHLESYGYNLNHIRNMMWRPFLTGAQYFIFHPAPKGLLNDVEQDGHYELNVLGETFHDIMDMSENLPDRGVAFASVGLLLDGDRNIALRKHLPTTSYLGLALEVDEADLMINGVLDHLFPVHSASAGYGLPNLTAPYGEIFDILSPNQRGAEVSAATLANYKVLFDLGGLKVDAQYARVLEEYVRNGGTLVMNIADLGTHLSPSFFGVSRAGETKKGNRVVSARDGREFAEETFSYVPLRTNGAEVLYAVADSKTPDGDPLVTLHRVGRGYAILVASRFMIQDETVPDRRSVHSRIFNNRPLLKMVPHFLDQLTAGTMPIELRCAPEDREDLTWWVHKTENSWLVFVQNYNQHKRFERRGGFNWNIIGDYEFVPIQYELVTQLPVVDIVDLYGRRNIPFEKHGHQIVATDYARYGDIRIYEVSAQPIELSRNRFVNYAKDRPARASGTLEMPTHAPKPDDVKTQRYSPRLAVDGSFDNRRFWQSGRGPDPKNYRTWNSLPLPAWLEVDLEQIRSVDHVTIQFHHRPIQDSVDMVPRLIRYTIEVSKNGRRWKGVVDESANAKRLRRRPVTKWFDPIEARYARVTVLSNSEGGGAQVVEFGVFGEDQENFVAQRKSPWIPARAWLPIEAQNWPTSKQAFLADQKPVSVNTRDAKNAVHRFGAETIRTHYSAEFGGHRYQKVLDVSAPHEMSYAIAADAQTFVAVGGFMRLFADRPGVVYRVYVDGQKRFDSGPYYGFDALPVVVDVRGGRTLKVVVEDLHDGTKFHRALLAEARFLLKQSSVDR